MFDKSIFSFCLCSKQMERSFEKVFEAKYSIGEMNLLVDDRTPLQHSELDRREIIIFGYAVNVITGESDNLAENMLKEVDDFQQAVDYEKNIGGKYIIFYREDERVYCMGDATCSVPVFYTTGLTDIVCCSNPRIIIDTYNLKPDKKLQKIRNSGPLNQAMPFDVTPYREIKQLIPNHYIDVSQQIAKRFKNCSKKQKSISPEKAAEITAPMIDKIANMYLSKFKVYCPLTSGRDSRVVYAFLYDMSNDVSSYTIWKDSFEKDNQDWTIPVSLAALTKTKHEQIYKESISEEMKSTIDNILGVNSYPQDAFVLSVTVNKHYSGCATIEGDIIGQVGKCSLHRDIPLFLATPGYFRCKLHNYSNEAKRFLKLWLQDVKKSGEMVNSFDLFSIENRLGVWASQTHLLRNVIGQPYVNIFNSRSIIYTWTAVNRAERMQSKIHISLIKHKCPELLRVPFEKEPSGLINFAKSNAVVFYFATFVKYYIQRKKFLKNKTEPKQ
ncbi:MAG: hypothetical protein IJZ57_05845 [Clostridia bacterium]|nr:hypothetical protein [Clostridia bacterium]